MGIASKIIALLVAIRREDIDQLAPVERRRLADLCRHVAALADRAGQTKAPSRFVAAGSGPGAKH